MKLIEKKILTDQEKRRIAEIWNHEYPKSLNFSESYGFDDYLKTISRPNHYVLVDENHVIWAWACKFTREGAKWFAVILDGSLHGKGKGTEILNAIKENEPTLNAWVIDGGNAIKLDGQLYKSPMDFYLKNGFKACPEIRFENEKMSAVKIVWKQAD